MQTKKIFEEYYVLFKINKNAKNTSLSIFDKQTLRIIHIFVCHIIVIKYFKS